MSLGPDGGTLADAAVEIVADVDRFEPSLQSGLRKAFRSVTRTISRDLRRSGEQAGEELGEGIRRGADGKLRDARGRFVTEGKTAGGLFGKGFGDGASKAITQSLDGITRGSLRQSVIKIAASFVTFLASFTPILPALGGAVAAVVALSGALVTASGSAIAAGVALSSLGLGAASIAVGFQGVTDAMKAQAKALEELNTEGKVSEATQKKLDAALKNLSPSARAVVQTLGKMAPAWAAVRRVVQDNLFQGVATQIQLLGAKFLPLLQVQLGGAAARINATAVSLSQFLRSGEQSARIGTIFSGLNRILGTLLTAVKPLTDAFLRIFAASLPSAERFAAAIAKLAVQFDAFITKTTKSGQFQEFLSTALDLGGQLVHLFGNVAKILAVVFQAGNAQGAGLLKLLGDLTGQLLAFLKSAEGQQALASFFGLIAVAARTVQDVFAVLGPVVAGVSAIFKALGPSLEALRAALLPIAITLGTTLGAALQALAPLFAQLLAGLTPLIAALGQGLVTVLQAVLLAVLPVLPALVTMATTLATQLAPQIPVLAASLAQLAIAFGEILVALLPAIPALTQILVAMIPLVPVIAQLITALAQIVSAIAVVVPGFVRMAVGADLLVAKLVGLVVGVIATGAAVGAAFARMIAAVLRWAQATTGGVDNVVGAFGRLVGRVLGFVAQVLAALARLAALVPGLIVKGFTAANGLVVSAGAKIVSSVASFAGKILSAIRSGLSSVGDLIAAPFRAAIGPVASALSSLLSTIESFAGKIRSAVSSVTSAASGVTGVGAGLINKGIKVFSNRDGGLITKPILTTVGEGWRKELILPLENKRRTRDLVLQNAPELMNILQPAMGKGPVKTGAGSGGGTGEVVDKRELHIHLTGNTNAEQLIALVEQQWRDKYGDDQPPVFHTRAFTGAGGRGPRGSAGVAA